MVKLLEKFLGNHSNIEKQENDKMTESITENVESPPKVPGSSPAATYVQR